MQRFFLLRDKANTLIQFATFLGSCNETQIYATGGGWNSLSFGTGRQGPVTMLLLS